MQTYTLRALSLQTAANATTARAVSPIGEPAMVEPHLWGRNPQAPPTTCLP